MNITHNHAQVPLDSGRIIIVDPVHLDPETVDYLTTVNEHGVALAAQFVTRGAHFVMADVQATATGFSIELPQNTSVTPRENRQPPATPGVS